MTERVTTAAAIAALTTEVQGMNKRLDMERVERKELDKEAADARVTMKESLYALEAGHGDIMRRLEKVEPVVDMVTSARNKMLGALVVLGVIGSVVAGGLAMFKDKIMQFVGM